MDQSIFFYHSHDFILLKTDTIVMVNFFEFFFSNLFISIFEDASIMDKYAAKKSADEFVNNYFTSS